MVLMLKVFSKKLVKKIKFKIKMCLLSGNILDCPLKKNSTFEILKLLLLIN